MENMKIDYDVNTSKHQKNEYTMRVGEHTATVTCKNKRDGKQRASQAILQVLIVVRISRVPSTAAFLN
jgi:microprocessor complex subunit DGCR8